MLQCASPTAFPTPVHWSVPPRTRGAHSLPQPVRSSPTNLTSSKGMQKRSRSVCGVGEALVNLELHLNTQKGDALDASASRCLDPRGQCTCSLGCQLRRLLSGAHCTRPIIFRAWESANYTEITYILAALRANPTREASNAGAAGTTASQAQGLHDLSGWADKMHHKSVIQAQQKPQKNPHVRT